MMKAIVGCLLVAAVLGDIYMHNPRGSNCRLNEANTNRNQGNRLFDTQNNAKGGYCIDITQPPMYFYEGSQLTVEWTNQHGCGNPKLECNMVMQYMCGFNNEPAETLIRDGTTTNRIPDDDTYTTVDPDTGKLLYGMHESRMYYQRCQVRERNKGLFIADQNPRNDATGTRQNPGGGRNGFECPEERDYYPYWHPSPWKDVAVLMDNAAKCDIITQESQNVKSKYLCVDSEDKPLPPNNQASCATTSGIWKEFPSHGIPAPDCIAAPWARDNHLGNGFDGFANTYNWTLPLSEHEPCIEEGTCVCIFRLRYNISTTDVDGWGLYGPMADYSQNAAASPITDDPNVDVGGQNVTLAIDTSQFARTFQDRTHTFVLSKRPDGIPDSARIYNLNVRGKRGNIVETYPAVEYDFVPETLHVRVGDYIHFQWTGCDKNPAGNAGEGTDQTDRSNIVQIETLGDSYPASEEWLKDNSVLFESPELRFRMAHLDQVGCLTYQQLLEKHNANDNAIEQDVQNCMKLNAAMPYFDGGLIQMNSTGNFYYMSSRNNNFSNRGQKGAIIVERVLPNWALGVVGAGAAVGAVSLGTAGAMMYARSHPSSGIANFFNKI